MVSIRAFSPLMTQRVTIEPWASSDAWGGSAYGTAVRYQCAVIGETSKVLNASGEEVVSMQAVYLMDNAAVRPRDRITLSTGDVGSTESYAINPEIITVERYPFTAGQYATVVRLK